MSRWPGTRELAWLVAGRWGSDTATAHLHGVSGPGISTISKVLVETAGAARGEDGPEAGITDKAQDQNFVDAAESHRGLLICLFGSLRSCAIASN